MLEFIVNPNAGGETGFSTWKTCERHLKKLNIPFKVCITDGPGDATRIAREATAYGGDITIVPVGGDGTFNEVLNGLNLSDNVTVGYIPTGSGNDLARGLKLSSNAIKALNVILERKNIINLDYGVITYGTDETVSRRFAVSTGIGYDAAVCVALNDSGLRRRLSKVKGQKAVYTMLGALEILKTKPVGGYLIMDDKRVDYDDIMFVSSQIHVTEGGGKPFTPHANPQDGLLSLCVMHNKSLPGFVKTLYYGLEGKHVEKSNADIYDSKSVKIHLDRPAAVHTDGEVLGYYSDVAISCVEGKLRMIV